MFTDLKFSGNRYCTPKRTEVQKNLRPFDNNLLREIPAKVSSLHGHKSYSHKTRQFHRHPEPESLNT
jgi:hypothetical protein